MRKHATILLTSVSLLAAATPSMAGRFGGGGFHGGGGMARGGAMARPGGLSGGMVRPMGGLVGGSMAGLNSGGGMAARGPLPQLGGAMRPGTLPMMGTGGAVHGPYGGLPNRPAMASGRAGSALQPDAAMRPGQGGAGTRHVWDTPRGGTIYAGGNRGPFGGSGAYAYSGPHGAVSIGGGRAGSISGSGGGSISGGRAGHVVIGPNGNVNAGGTRGGTVVGPGGRTIAGGSHAGGTVGPQGAEIHGSRGGVASGPRGTIAAGSRGAAAVGPHGAAAAGGRFVAGRGAYGEGVAGTRFVAASDLRNQGFYVRDNFRYWNSFTPAWYVNHPGAWFAAGWAAGAVWNACTWDDCLGYFGYPAETPAVYYNYGDNVTYQDGSVYYDGEPYATEDEYAQQAADLAAQGAQAEDDDDEQWQPLGVFAMVKGDETTSNDIFQIALNADGVLRGNYYNATTDQTTPILGSLDKSSQRLAWSIQGDDATVYETGLYNLTQDETTMLVHFGKDHTEQYKLFRVQQEEGTQQEEGAQQEK